MDEHNQNAPEEFEPTIRMERPKNDAPDDFEPTIRMERPEDTATTRTAKVSRHPADENAERPFEKEEKSSVGIFFEHITGMFRRKPDAAEVDAAPKPEDHGKVSLDQTDAADFPQLETAFERGEEIGAGGQARLYRGFDLNLRRTAAVKSLREEHGKHPELREKFVSEAMITAQLDHPAIVPVYSIHRDRDNQLHLAMKLINGRPFQRYLGDLVRRYDRDGFSASEEQRSLDYRLEVFLAVCDALEYAHNRNIMHCDLKPENIMIGEYHEAYLMDWGLAQRIDDDIPVPESWHAPTVITGTPRFLSPEAVRGEHCDRRADIYAMGLILYELVTLQYAYPGSDHRETVNRIRRGEMRPVTHRYKYPIPVDLRKIILKAAAWDREKRYKSMEEFSSDVRRFIRGEEVSANPDSVFGKLARWSYRHRRLMLGLVLVATTLGALGVAYSLYDRVQADRIEAARAEFRHHRELELSRALGRAIGAGRSMDRQISKLEHGLYAAATEAMLLLNADLTVRGDTPIYSLADLHRGRRPNNMVMSRGFGFEVGLDDLAYHVSPGCSPRNLEDRMRRLTLLTPKLLRTLVESRDKAELSEGNLVMLREQTLRNGAPLTSIYLGFSDGLFVTYPCESSLPEDYNHLNRQWYRERLDGSRRGDSLLWGSPYLSANGDLVLSCTMPMIDTRGKLHGIAGIDASLPQLVEALRGSGNQGGAVLEKTIVDADGNVVVDLGENFLRDSRNNYTEVNGELKLIRYPDQELLNQIRGRRTGYVVRRENDRETVYFFSGLFAVPWVYIEKLDLDKLLREHGIARPEER